MMAVSFPLALGNFWSRLPISDLVLEPTDPVITSRTRSGQVLVAQVGDVLWRGTVTLAHRSERDSEFARAMLQLLRRTGGSFEVTPTQRRGPLADRDGAALGFAVPQIASVDPGRREIDIGGLPPGYVLATGDYLSCRYGSAPERLAFHQVVTGGQAGIAGTMSGVEVTPPLPPGVTAPRDLVLVQPVLFARLDAAPGYGRFLPAGKVDGLSFSIVQSPGG